MREILLCRSIFQSNIKLSEFLIKCMTWVNFSKQFFMTRCFLDQYCELPKNILNIKNNPNCLFSKFYLHARNYFRELLVKCDIDNWGRGTFPHWCATCRRVQQVKRTKRNVLVTGTQLWQNSWQKTTWRRSDFFGLTASGGVHRVQRAWLLDWLCAVAEVCGCCFSHCGHGSRF